MNTRGESFNNLSLIGEGSRRRCYRLPGQTLCVKFYRDPFDLPKQTRLSIRGEVFAARFFRWININRREWRYHQNLKKRLPPALMAIFPEMTELVYSSEYGWGIVESLIQNADGTLPQPLLIELEKMTDPVLRERVYEAVENLFDQLVEHAVCFFDQFNLLLQWTGPGTFRLRIADFEPRCRAAVPGLSHIKPFVRSKMRRRCRRFLNHLRTAHVPEENKRTTKTYYYNEKSRMNASFWRHAEAWVKPLIASLGL